MNMAIKKLFQLASTTPVDTLTDTNYFYTVTAAIPIASGSNFALLRTKWSTGSGAIPTTFGVRSNGYYNLFINGVLQQSVLYSVVPTSNVHLLNPGTGSYTVPQSAPITLSLAKSSLTPTKVAVP